MALPSVFGSHFAGSIALSTVCTWLRGVPVAITVPATHREIAKTPSAPRTPHRDGRLQYTDQPTCTWTTDLAPVSFESAIV